MAIKYNVIEGRGKVVALLEGTEMDAINLIRKRSQGCLDVSEMDWARMRNRYTASVTCDPEDEFSVEVGKDKAKARLLDKYDRDMARVIGQLGCMAETVYSTYDSCCEYMDKRVGRAEQRRAQG